MVRLGFVSDLYVEIGWLFGKKRGGACVRAGRPFLIVSFFLNKEAFGCWSAYSGREAWLATRGGGSRGQVSERQSLSA